MKRNPHNGTTDRLRRLAAGRGWGTFPCSHADRWRVADRIRQLGRQAGIPLRIRWMGAALFVEVRR